MKSEAGSRKLIDEHLHFSDKYEEQGGVEMLSADRDIGRANDRVEIDQSFTTGITFRIL